MVALFPSLFAHTRECQGFPCVSTSVFVCAYGVRACVPVWLECGLVENVCVGCAPACAPDLGSPRTAALHV